MDDRVRSYIALCLLPKEALEYLSPLVSRGNLLLCRKAGTFRFERPMTGHDAAQSKDQPYKGLEARIVEIPETETYERGNGANEND